MKWAEAKASNKKTQC